MSIWFCQVEGREIFLIDYYEEASKGLLHFISHVKNKPYGYSNHWAPHDIKKSQDSDSGQVTTRWNVARDLGIEFRVVPMIPLMDGIDSARAVIPRCYFDRIKCDQGIRALINYHREFNMKTQDYRNNPVHDASSHGADAFRYLSIIVDREIQSQIIGSRPIQYIKEFNIFDDLDGNKEEKENSYL
jgi:hypothetical protein